MDIQSFVRQFLNTYVTGYCGMLIIGDNDGPHVSVLVNNDEIEVRYIPGSRTHLKPLTPDTAVVNLISYTQQSPWVFLHPTEWLGRLESSAAGDRPSWYMAIDHAVGQTHIQLPGTYEATIEQRAYDLVNQYVVSRTDEIVVGFPLCLQLKINGHIVKYVRRPDGTTYINLGDRDLVPGLETHASNDMIYELGIPWSSNYNRAINSGITSIDLRKIILSYRDKMGGTLRPFAPYGIAWDHITDLIRVTDDGDVVLPRGMHADPLMIYDTYQYIHKMLYQSDKVLRKDLISRVTEVIGATGVEVDHLFKRYSQCRIYYNDSTMGQMTLNVHLLDVSVPLVEVMSSAVALESIVASKLDVTGVAFQDGPTVTLTS